MKTFRTFGFLTFASLLVLFSGSARGGVTQDQEKAVGPWLDLQGNGWAVNAPSTMNGVDGVLQNATQLPARGEGFVRIGRENETWGTGFMISLLQSASAAYMAEADLKVPVHVGAIAQQFGGHFKPHSSHQNGLDVDILYMGQTKWMSVLDKEGQPTERFQPERNWRFWRLLYGQKILLNGQTTSVLGYVFVSPELKRALCSWANAQNLLANPDDAEIMKRISPLQGHDDHFHVRLRCSPYQTLCKDRVGIPKTTGC